MIRRCCVALVVGCLAGMSALAAEPDADVAKREKDILAHWQGTFELISIEDDGKSTTGDALKSRKLTVEGANYHFQNGAFNEHGSYRFDLTKLPKHLDIIVGDGADKGKVYLAAFDANEKQITICFQKKNEKRPDKLTGAAGSGMILEVWQKVSK
ncbi:MAG: TIGR03067 domain-containing protein [Pirellulales bacterium]